MEAGAATRPAQGTFGRAPAPAPTPVPAPSFLSALTVDPPVISPDLPQTSAGEVLDPGTVLAVTAYVWERGVGAVFSRDAVLITDDGPEVLTSSPAFNSAAVGTS